MHSSEPSLPPDAKSAEQEIYDWMKSTPVAVAKRPSWLADHESWTPRFAPQREVSRLRKSAPRSWVPLSMFGAVASTAAAAWYVLS